jgi:hypothetical protein
VAAGGRGTPFLHFGLLVRVWFCFVWHIVGIVGATSRRINLPQLYSHIGDDLQGGISELIVRTGPSDRQLGLLVSVKIWWDQCLDVSLAFMVILDGTGGQARWFF